MGTSGHAESAANGYHASRQQDVSRPMEAGLLLAQWSRAALFRSGQVLGSAWGPGAGKLVRLVRLASPASPWNLARNSIAGFPEAEAGIAP